MYSIIVPMSMLLITSEVMKLGMKFMTLEASACTFWFPTTSHTNISFDGTHEVEELLNNVRFISTVW
jgi:hypothetical protein